MAKKKTYLFVLVTILSDNENTNSFHCLIELEKYVSFFFCNSFDKSYQKSIEFFPFPYLWKYKKVGFESMKMENHYFVNIVEN